jgi:hypothetical protein
VCAKVPSRSSSDEEYLRDLPKSPSNLRNPQKPSQ